jgi:hypothetical protein
MSSPRTAKAPPRARASTNHRLGAVQPAKAPLAGAPVNGSVDSHAAEKLAADMERALANGRPDLLSTAALQALMAAVCKTYAAQIEAGAELLPLPPGGVASATDVMVTASGLLRAANLAVFELGMWQSWTGR